MTLHDWGIRFAKGSTMPQSLASLTRCAATLLLAGMAIHSPAAMAQTGHDAHQHGAAPAAAAKVALDDAVVKKVDKAAGKLTLAHGALSNGMPPMTMVYKVKDAALLANLQPGQKVRFAVADDGMTVVRLEAAK
jgi:Cu/Ag efflux protein CusF